MNITQKDPSTSIAELELSSSNETEKKKKKSSKRLPNRWFHYVSFEHIHLNPSKLLF